MNKKSKGARGGVRLGAGRPVQTFPSRSYSFRFRQPLIDRLDALAEWLGLNRTEAIEWLIEEDFLRRARRDDS